MGEQPRHELELHSDQVARLTRPERELRVGKLMARSHEIIGQGILANGGGRPIVAKAVLFSGGNDSTTLLHLMRQLGQVTHAVHANTGIGIEETRTFVRDICATWDIPLIEEHPPPGSTYRELVLERGFPGPAQHWKMYQRLKERCLDQSRGPLGVHRSHKKRALFIAGRRREESARRSDIVLHEPDGSVIWVSPLAEWTKLDLNTYRLMFDVPVNEVSQLIHMSGECLCGAFAKVAELEMIGDWFPAAREQIEALEAELADRDDIPEERRTWGWGAYRDTVRPSRRTGRLCASCKPPTLFEVEERAA